MKGVEFDWRKFELALETVDEEEVVVEVCQTGVLALMPFPP